MFDAAAPSAQNHGPTQITDRCCIEVRRAAHSLERLQDHGELRALHAAASECIYQPVENDVHILRVQHGHQHWRITG